MKTIDLAIIIPTLNEEKYIGKLLESIYSQNWQPTEIVVVDAFSKDCTEDAVKHLMKKLPQLKFYQIPRHSIARQRNFGAKKTKASKLLFLDADTALLEKDTLKKYITEVDYKKAKMAVAENYPLSDHWKDKAYFQAANFSTKLGKLIWPVAVGINLYCERQIFETFKGFDEGIKVGEDLELVERFAKKGIVYEILESPKIYTSVRRLRKEGRIRFVLKMINSFILTHVYGYKNNPVAKEYEFGKHTPIES